MLCSGNFFVRLQLIAKHFELVRVALSPQKYATKLALQRVCDMDCLRQSQEILCNRSSVSSNLQAATECQRLCRYGGDSESASVACTSSPQPDEQQAAEFVCSDCRFWQQKFQAVAGKTALLCKQRIVLLVNCRASGNQLEGTSNRTH